MNCAHGRALKWNEKQYSNGIQRSKCKISFSFIIKDGKICGNYQSNNCTMEVALSASARKIKFDHFRVVDRIQFENLIHLHDQVFSLCLSHKRTDCNPRNTVEVGLDFWFVRIWDETKKLEGGFFKCLNFLWRKVKTCPIS